jgi:hypothetical protein
MNPCPGLDTTTWCEAGRRCGHSPLRPTEAVVVSVAQLAPLEPRERRTPFPHYELDDRRGVRVSVYSKGSRANVSPGSATPAGARGGPSSSASPSAPASRPLASSPPGRRCGNGDEPRNRSPSIGHLDRLPRVRNSSRQPISKGQSRCARPRVRIRLPDHHGRPRPSA